MQFEQIIYEVKSTTAIVTLNRPEKRNALSAQILRELSAALRRAAWRRPAFLRRRRSQ
jgi:enoyl-CoA hydratase